MNDSTMKSNEDVQGSKVPSHRFCCRFCQKRCLSPSYTP